MAATDLFDLCAEYLAACQAALAGTPGGAIERAYVSPGSPVIDCPAQLTVHAGGSSEASTAPLSPPLSPGHRGRVQGAVYLARMTATVARCVPVFTEDGEAPAAVDLEAAANMTSADVWAIWNHIRTECMAGALFASPSGMREVLLDDAIPLDPSGGVAGWLIPIRVQLDGYRTS